MTEHGSGTSSPRPGLSSIASRLLRVWAAMALALIYLFCLDLFAVGWSGTHTSTFALVALMSAGIGLALALITVPIHLAPALPASFPLGRRPLAAGGLIAAIVAAPLGIWFVQATASGTPLWQQSLLVGAAILLGTLLGLWHLVGLRPELGVVPEADGATKDRVVWTLIGVAAAAALVLLSHQVTGREHLMLFTVPGLAFIVSTLVLRAARGTLATVIFVSTLVGAIGFGSVYLGLHAKLTRDARDAVLNHPSATAVVTGAVAPTSAPATRLSFDELGAFQCPPSPARAIRPPVDIAEAHRRNVILIGLDAFRADNLGKEAGGRAVTPNLDGYFGRAVRFARATTPYPATLMALTAMANGHSPSHSILSPTAPMTVFQHGQERERVAVLPDSAWFHTDAFLKMVARGADVQYSTTARNQTTATITAMERARRAGKPITIFAHYYEGHQPWRQHRDFAFGEGRADKYYAEIAYVDRELGRLLTYIEREGFYRNSLVIVFGTHGQALGERSQWGQQQQLHGWLTDVPLGVRYHGSTTQDVSTRVDLTDIYATVAHFLGGKVSPYVVGESLLHLLEPPETPRGRVSEMFPFRGRDLHDLAVRRATGWTALRSRAASLRAPRNRFVPRVSYQLGDHRLFGARDRDEISIFSTTTDPGEESDLAASEPRRRDAMLDALRSTHAEWSRRIYCAQPRNVREQARR